MNDALKQGGRGGIGGAAAGTRDALVILEVAAALVLMVGAGLMLQTVARLHQTAIRISTGYKVKIKQRGVYMTHGIKTEQYTETIGSSLVSHSIKHSVGRLH